MWRHDHVSNARIVGQRDGDGGRSSQGVAPAVQDLSDAVQVRRSAVEHLDDGRIDDLSAVGVDELQQPDGLGAEVLAPLGEHREVSTGVRGGVVQSIETASLAGFALVRDQLGVVRGVFDRFAATPRARVGGDLLVLVDDTNVRPVRDDVGFRADGLRENA